MTHLGVLVTSQDKRATFTYYLAASMKRFFILQSFLGMDKFEFRREN